MTNTFRNTVLWLSAIVTTGFGLTLLVAPESLMKLYGSTANDATIILARLFAGVTLAFTVLAVASTRLDDSRAMRAIDSTFLAGYAFIALADVWNIIQYGTLGATLVASVTLTGYVLFAGAFAYFVFRVDMPMGSSQARHVS